MAIEASSRAPGSALKILHVCTDFWPVTGGIEHFVLDLARSTAALGAESRVLCHRRPRGYPSALPSHDQIDGIPIVRVPRLDLKFYKPTWLPLKILRWADVIHVHGIGAPLDGVALTQPSHRRPIVVSTHGGIFHTPTLLGLKNWYFDHIVPLSGRRVSQFLACSKNDQRLFSRVVERVMLLENGVALPAPAAAARDNNRLLHVGRLSENKRIDNLVQTVAQLRALGRKVKLRVVGPDWDGNAARFTELVRKLHLEEQVQFVGEVSTQQLAIEYASAAWLVSASQFEGFGLAVVEAMGAGCVPIVNRIPAFLDIVDDRRNGFIVNFDDPPAAAAELNPLLGTAPQADVVAAARKKAASYSWENKAPQFMEVYRAVCQTHEH